MRLLAVNYHYFRAEKPGSGIYPLSLGEFESQLDEIARHYRFVSQQELLEMHGRDEYPDRNLCLLTFDDGLKEQMDVFDLLLRKGIPGMFFVSTEALQKQTVLFVHKLHYIRSVMNDEQMYEFLDHHNKISSYALDDHLLQNQYRYDSVMARRIKYFLNFVLDTNERHKLVDDLFNELVVDENKFSTELYMDREDLKRLAAQVMLGSHAHTHRPLATLSDEDARLDMQQSLDFLHQSTGGKAIKMISYPYGGKSAVSEKVAQISHELGFSLGVTMNRGMNSAEDFMRPLMLNRIDTNDAPGGKNCNKEFYP